MISVKWHDRMYKKYESRQARKTKQSRRSKKYIDLTRKAWRRNDLRMMRIREHCKHDESDMQMAYTYITGEYVQELDYGYCGECGMSEMEMCPDIYPSYWKNRAKNNRPKKLRWRTINRLYGSAEYNYANSGQ